MDKEQQREFVIALEELAVARGMDKMALIRVSASKSTLTRTGASLKS
jgi:hypothetical protein